MALRSQAVGGPFPCVQNHASRIGWRQAIPRLLFEEEGHVHTFPQEHRARSGIPHQYLEIGTLVLGPCARHERPLSQHRKEGHLSQRWTAWHRPLVTHEALRQRRRRELQGRREEDGGGSEQGEGAARSRRQGREEAFFQREGSPSRTGRAATASGDPLTLSRAPQEGAFGRRT